MDTAALILEQKNIAEALQNSARNVKKDSSSRKTEEYFSKRLSDIEKLWHEFRDNNEKLMSTLQDDHPYFEQKIFATTEKVYRELKDRLIEGQQAVMQHQNVASAQMIQSGNVPASTVTTTAASYAAPTVTAPANWPPYMDISTSYGRHHPNLPPITIPKFNGDYQQWKTFIELYKSIIHNNNTIGATQKMQHLLSYLEGDARNAVSHLQLSAANYETTLAILQERFSNNRQMVTNYIDTILDAEKVVHRCPTSLLALHDILRNCLAALKSLEYNTEHWEPIIVRVALRKLDAESLRIFEESVNNTKEMPSLKQVYNFLMRRHMILTSLKSPQLPRPATQKKAFVSLQQKAGKSEKRAATKTYTGECKFCSQNNHAIHRCDEFKKLSVDERHRFVADNNLCKNCLAHESRVKCKSKNTCFECKKPHHTLLHYLTTDRKTVTSNMATSNTKATVNTSASSVTNTVLLATAIVKAESYSGQQIPLRALVDPGSQTSFISSKAAKLLGLPSDSILAGVTGIGGVQAKTVRKRILVTITPRFPSDFRISVEALIMPRLTTMLPDRRITLNLPHNLKALNLADPQFHLPGAIDMIIGADVFEEIVEDSLIKGKPLLAQKTKFGWILSGKTGGNLSEAKKITSLVSMAEFHKKIEKFFEIDGEQNQNEQSNANTECENHFQTTYSRGDDGRYIVRLPFKENQSQNFLGESRTRALLRYRQIEKKLATDEKLAVEYNTFLEEYLKLGHMTCVTPYIGNNKDVYYLPHHAVIKESSSTTKIRVVFDASAKTLHGPSLNDKLHTGARLQQNLAQILLRWRKYLYVYTADIEKMFRQIQMHRDDRNYQRILWRRHPQGTIAEYQLNTVTYGTACATFLAVRTLMQLAQDEERNYPIASLILKNDFYVDDMLTGAQTKEEAISLQQEMTALLNRGNFNLRKWASNSPELLSHIPEDRREVGLLEFNEDPSLKTLGIHWNPAHDAFHFKITAFNESKVATKRQLLSYIATIYDPLQWLAPVTIRAKLIMQSIWKSGTDWDEKPTEDILRNWNEFESELKLLEHISIPRWNHYNINCQMELHGFCDASESAYAAVVYSKVIDMCGSISTTLLCAKTKVAPTKTKVTLPKLELNGALLLATLLHDTMESLCISNCDVYAWCDSTITLGWLKKEPTSLETYIANRVSKVQQLDRGAWKWQHISSKDNPADCASRGISPKQLLKHNLWWNGPSWLTHPCTDIKVVSTVTTAEDKNNIFERYSDFNRLLRVTATCLRFYRNCTTQKSNRKTGRLEAEELEIAHTIIITMIQKTEFSEEIAELRSNKELKKRLRTLNPFLDAHNILRVGGRLRNASIPEEAKHPILLPQRHHVTYLIVRQAHLKTMHGGAQLVRNYLRMRYWIINDQKVIRYKIHRCIICCKYSTAKNHQLMGDLPAIRVTPEKAFTHCGVDYAGPFTIRRSKGRGAAVVKAYIALFVCMVTKAIHLELVSDMSTEAFLAAFKRFTSRRGLCREIFSDHGTNFVGASNRLDKDLEEAIKRSSSELARITAKDGITWKFIPVSTPHFGGLWEAGVKSVKNHIKCIFDEQNIVPTFEEFTTILCQIEACLNSRPITPISSDPNDLGALTPGHFLIGRPLLAIPEPDISCKTLHQRWKILTNMHQVFWKRWTTEYLQHLQKRTKWTSVSENPRIGQLVLIKERDTPPTKWPLARIHSMQPGRDGIVRTVTVRHHGNMLKQVAITNLCKLPVDIPEDSTSKPTAITPVEKPAASIELTESKSSPDKCEERSTPETSISNCMEQKITAGRRRIAPTDKPNKAKRPRIAPCMWARALLNTTILLSVMMPSEASNAKNSSNQHSYDLFRPKSGFYIEKLGIVHSIRGELRLEANFPIAELIQDTKNILSTGKQIEDMCQRTKELTDYTHCNGLMNHLQIKQNVLLQQTEKLQTITGSRKKRGLVGDLLTTVFGVNDKVYTDIDTLDKNQHTILQVLNQQSVELNARITNINHRTDAQLAQFTMKLNQVVDSINEMQKWFTKIDNNKIGLQVISTYLMAINYFEELHVKYQKLVNTIYGFESFPQFVSMETMTKTMEKVASKIGPHFEILHTPVKATTIRRTDENIIIYGYFHIIERDRYELIHVTAIPFESGVHQYLVPIVKTPTLAVNFNQLTYFELDDTQLKSCTIKDERYLCTPSMINNMDANPNCIINELYSRHKKQPCPSVEVTSSQTTWKELMMKNSWLFVASTPSTALFICKDDREEILLENIGIIRTKENCAIQTERFILRSEMTQQKGVLTSFTKEVAPAKFGDKEYHAKSMDPIARVKEQIFDGDSFKPEPIATTTTLQQLRKHAVSLTSTMLIIIAICIASVYIRSKLKKTWMPKKSQESISTASEESVSLKERFNIVLTGGAPTCSTIEQSLQQ